MRHNPQSCGETNQTAPSNTAASSGQRPQEDSRQQPTTKQPNQQHPNWLENYTLQRPESSNAAATPLAQPTHPRHQHTTATGNQTAGTHTPNSPKGSLDQGMQYNIGKPQKHSERSRARRQLHSIHGTRVSGRNREAWDEGTARDARIQRGVS
jgi:hypothetical protein